MIRILQLTDLHVFATPNQRLKGIPTRESFERVVDHILQHEKPFDHVIVTGDHTHDELPASYKAVAKILLPWSDRLWQIPGNHDDRAVMRTVFGGRIGHVEQPLIQFEFSAGDWLMIGLDTHRPGEVSGEVTEEQMVELRLTLQRTEAARIGLFMHHPPVDVNSVWMDAIGLHNRNLLQDIVCADQRIRLICCGHVHHEFQSSLGEALVVATPSTGIQFEPDSHTPCFAEASPVYRIFELNGSEFDTHVERLPGVKYPLVLN